MRLSEEGDERPIAFISKKLSHALRNYTVTEQECLAAVVTVKNFRAYREGHAFTIVTDHASLRWLMSNQDLNFRLARWSIALGKHVVPDTLSHVNKNEVAAVDMHEGLLLDLSSKLFKLDSFKDLVEKVAANANRFPDLKTEGRYLYRKAEHLTGEQVHDEYAWKLWLPTKRRWSGRGVYFWPRLVADVKAHINACETCKTTKPPNNSF